MPVLRNLEKLDKFYLPSTQGLDAEGKPTQPEGEWAWVVMDISPIKGADMYAVEDVGKQGKAMFDMLTERIREWNYTDEEGKVIKIDVDSVKRLNMNDVRYLQDQIQEKDSRELNDEQKKTSSDTSPATTATTVPVTQA